MSFSSRQSHRTLSGGRRVAVTAVVLGAAATLSAAVAHADASAPHGSGTASTTQHGTTLHVSGTSMSSAQVKEAGAAGRSGDRAAGFAFRTLDDPADPTFTQLLGIDDHARIVGYFGSGADAAHPNKGVRIRAPYTTFVNENVPGSAQTQVVGINDAGVTVGFSVDAAGANTGFVAVDGRFVAVAHPNTDPNKPFNQLLGINDRGIAAGFYTDAAGAAHGYTYDIRRATFRDVTLPVTADAVTATGVNNDGAVSGFYAVGQTTRGFLLEADGSFHVLSFGARTNTQALGVNSSDQVVGSYLDAAGAMHGFLWSHGRLTRVDDPHGAGGSLVNGLNNRGRLVGFYVDAAGNTHGFLATRS